MAPWGSLCLSQCLPPWPKWPGNYTSFSLWCPDNQSRQDFINKRKSGSNKSVHDFLGLLLPAYHDEECQEADAHRHDRKAVQEPGAPNHGIGDTLVFQGLLQSQLLLQDDALYGHGDGVDPGQHHEDREAAVQDDHKTKAKERSRTADGLAPGGGATSVC